MFSKHFVLTSSTLASLKLSKTKYRNSRLQFPGRASQAPQLQQASVGDPQRVFLLAPVQPLPQRGGERGAGAEVRHYRVPGTVTSLPLSVSSTRVGSGATSPNKRSSCSTSTSTRTSPTPTPARRSRRSSPGTVGLLYHRYLGLPSLRGAWFVAQGIAATISTIYLHAVVNSV